MQFSIIAITALISAAVALPTVEQRAEQKRQIANLCASGTPLCCDVDILGVANLNCEAPERIPTDNADFVAACAENGKIDQCCLVPILGQGLLCAAAS